MTQTMHPSVVPLDGSAHLPRASLGNKGHGIDIMRRHRLPVPPAFCITTEVCAHWFKHPDTALDGLRNPLHEAISRLEQETSRTFGHGPHPLLVSVRSGAALSMPGMMDTVLNLGMNDTVEHALTTTVSERFARDTRARFADMYRRIVLGGDTSVALPDDPFEQLRGAIEAVFASWNSPRAVTYRDHHGHHDLGGTAVVVQAMVFGNGESNSGTGVLFSRNPLTGDDQPFGEWLPGGQGEDIVSGAFDVQPVSALAEQQPQVYEELLTAARLLERLGTDVQDIEYTVEEGKLWLLQTRAAKRSAQAAVRLAVTLRREGLIEDTETLRRVTAAHIATLMLPALQPETRLAATLLARGLPACSGVVSGKAYTEVDDALDAADGGEDVILVRSSTSPDDVQGMLAAQGIVTEIGGATSHAAVVSRELGRPAVVGCGAGISDVLAGKLITVDGGEGEVREGILPLTAWSEDNSADLAELTDIALAISPLRAHIAGDHHRLDAGSEAAIQAALAAGQTDVLSPTPLITMLTAVRLAGTLDGS